MGTLIFFGIAAVLVGIGWLLQSADF